MKKKKDHLPSGQCAVPQVNENNGQIERVGRTSASSATPSDYWLIADLKKMLQGQRFGSNEEIRVATEAYFEAKDKSFYYKHSSVGMIVPHLKVIMLTNTNEFWETNVVSSVSPGTY